MKLSEALSRAKEAQELVMSMVLNKDDLLNQRTKALKDLIGAVEKMEKFHVDSRDPDPFIFDETGVLYFDAEGE